MRIVVSRMYSACRFSINPRSAQYCMKPCDEYTFVSVLSQSLNTALRTSSPCLKHRPELRSIMQDTGFPGCVELPENGFHSLANLQVASVCVANLGSDLRAFIEFHDANYIGGLRFKDFGRGFHFRERQQPALAGKLLGRKFLAATRALFLGRVIGFPTGLAGVSNQPIPVRVLPPPDDRAFLEHLGQPPFEHVHYNRCPAAAHVVRDAYLGSLDLALDGLALQLLDDFHNLLDPSGSHRMSAGLQAPRGVDRCFPVKVRLPLLNQAAGLAVPAQAQVLHGHDFRNRKAVMHFNQVQVLYRYLGLGKGLG